MDNLTCSSPQRHRIVVRRVVALVAAITVLSAMLASAAFAGTVSIGPIPVKVAGNYSLQIQLPTAATVTDKTADGFQVVLKNGTKALESNVQFPAGQTSSMASVLKFEGFTHWKSVGKGVTYSYGGYPLVGYSKFVTGGVITFFSLKPNATLQNMVAGITGSVS